MFDLFKRRDWKPEIVEEMKGSLGSLHVVVRNFSCLLDGASEKRKYPYDEFGYEFIEELHVQLGNFEFLRQVLRAGSTKIVHVRLKDLPAIEVQVTGSALRKAQFDDELAELLAMLFKEHHITP